MRIKGKVKRFPETDLPVSLAIGEQAEIELSALELLEQITHREIGELLNLINLPQSTKGKCNHIPNASNCHYPLATCTCKPAEKEKGIEELVSKDIGPDAYITHKTMADKINEIIRRINKEG